MGRLRSSSWTHCQWPSSEIRDEGRQTVPPPRRRIGCRGRRGRRGSRGRCYRPSWSRMCGRGCTRCRLGRASHWGWKATGPRRCWPPSPRCRWRGPCPPASRALPYWSAASLVPSSVSRSMLAEPPYRGSLHCATTRAPPSGCSLDVQPGVHRPRCRSMFPCSSC